MVVALMGIGAGDAAARWHAVGGKLPEHYHLLETARGYGPESSVLGEACYGGRPHPQVDEELSCDDNSLSIFTLRQGRTVGPFDYPSGRDHKVRIRGRGARWHWLEEEGYRYARELVWSPRKGLRVSVVAQRDKLGLQDLLGIGRGVRAIDGDAWKLLLRQSSASARAGRFEPGMKRIRAATGMLAGRRWALNVLIPPDYPLSKNDLRPACTEVTYRGDRGHGAFCSGYVDRVGGQMFVFGPIEHSWERIAIRSFEHEGLIAEAPTHRVPGYSRSQFFGLPVRNDYCHGYGVNPDDSQADGPLLVIEDNPEEEKRCFGRDR